MFAKRTQNVTATIISNEMKTQALTAWERVTSLNEALQTTVSQMSEIIDQTQRRAHKKRLNV